MVSILTAKPQSRRYSRRTARRSKTHCRPWSCSRPALVLIERNKLLTGMTQLLIEHLTPSTRGPTLADPEAVARQTRSVLEALQAALQSPNEATRVGAARALRYALQSTSFLALLAPGNLLALAVNTDTLLAAVSSASADPIVDVRKEAVAALASLAAALDREPPSALRFALQDPSPLVRNTATVGVAGFRKGLSPCLTDLFRIMADNEPEGVGSTEPIFSLRSRCLLAIRLIKSEPTARALPVLTAALSSPYCEVRGAAATLLGRTGPDGVAAVPALVGALKRSLDPTPRSVQAVLDVHEPPEIVSALQHIDPSGTVVHHEIVPILVNALALDYRNARYSAIMALPLLGQIAEPAVPALVEVIKQKDRRMDTREVAAGALVQIARGTPSADMARSALEVAFRMGLIPRDIARQLDAPLSPAERKR